MQEACRSPQLTEHPPQLPRGEEGGTLQEFTCPLRSVLAGPAAAALGGPASLEGTAFDPFSLATQAANVRAKSAPAMSDAPDRMRQE